MCNCSEWSSPAQLGRFEVPTNPRYHFRRDKSGDNYMGRRSLKRLNASEIERVRLLMPELSEERFEIAKQHLVDGIPQSALYKKYDVPKNSLNLWVKAIWETYLKNTFKPEGWVSITVCLPEAVAQDVQEKADELKREYMRKHHKPAAFYSEN